MLLRWFNRSIQTRLLILLVTLSVISLAAVALLGFQTSSQVLEMQVRARLLAEVQARANKMDTYLSSTSRLSMTLARLVEADANFSEDGLKERLRRVMISNDGIHALLLGFEPGRGEINRKFFAPAWVMRNGTPTYQPINADYFGSVWYAPARQQRSLVWTAPYMDAVDTGQVMISAVTPMFRNDSGQEVFLGVAAVEIPVDRLARSLRDLTVNSEFVGQAHALLIDRNGNILAGDDPLLLASSLQELTQLKIDQVANGQLQALGKKMLAGRTDIERMHLPFGEPIEVFSAYTSLPETGWSIVLFAPLSILMDPINSMRTNFILVALAAIVITSVLVLPVTVPLVRALKVVVAVAQRLAAGDVALSGLKLVDVDRLTHRQDEIGEVGRAFQSLMNYLRELAESAQRAAQGDLTVVVNVRSEQDVAGQAFAQMVGSLREVTRQVVESARRLASASHDLSVAADGADLASSQISLTIHQVANGATQQSQAATQTAASVEAMNQVISGVAQGAEEQSRSIAELSAKMSKLSRSANDICEGANRQAEQMEQAIQQQSEMEQAIQLVVQAADGVAQDALHAAQSAEQGTQIAHETDQGMARMRQTTDRLAERVRDLGKRSAQIEAIVETIDDIASQTNLLALNAAIEAARAGEYGKGFAVVADEVRKLAERSALATKEITAMIHGIQTEASDAVQAMELAGQDVAAAEQLAHQAGTAFESITQGTHTSSLRAGDIHAALQVMYAATQSLQALIQQADAIAAQNRQLAESMSTLNSQMIVDLDSVSAVVETNTSATEKMAAEAMSVSTAIENIASISEENSAIVEEVSANTQEMSGQVVDVAQAAQNLLNMAEALQSAVSHFQLD